MTTDKQAVKNKPISRTTVILLGVLLALIGLLGLLLPAVLSLALTLSLGWFMVAGGLLWGWYSFRDTEHSLVGWLKPLGLFIAGLLTLLYPLPGVAALTLLVAFYLLLDSFAGFSMAMEWRPRQGWGWMLFNGLLSLTLAILILLGWPQASLLYLGIFIGISLLMDGMVLLMLGIAAGRQGGKDDARHSAA